MNNLVVRTISSIVYGAVIIVGLLWCRYSYAVVMLWFMVMMMYEFYRMTMGKTYQLSQVLAIVSAVILFLLTFGYKSFEIPGAYVVAALIPIFAIMVDSLYVKDKTEFGKFANIYTGILYIAIPVTLTNFSVFNGVCDYSGIPMLSLFILIWATDTGGYIFGMSLGQRYGKKLFPEISPKKSWIGFWGGLAIAMIVGLVLHLVGFLTIGWWQSMLLGAAVSIAAVYGDLIESQWKRYYAVKDSGNGIPGHGGYLDRLDSSLLAIPVGIICMELLKLI